MEKILRSVLVLCTSTVIGFLAGLFLPTVLCAVLFYGVSFALLYAGPVLIAKCRGRHLSHSRDTDNFFCALIFSVFIALIGAVVGLPISVLFFLTLLPFLFSVIGAVVGLGVGIYIVVLYVCYEEYNPDCCCFSV